MSRLTTVAASACIALVSACGTGEPSVRADTETTIPGPTTTTEPPATSVPVPVTLPWKKGAANAAWKAFLESYEVLDVSKFSRSECGLYAVLVTEGSVTFYFWDGRTWIDQTRLLDGGQGDTPTGVVSADFTNDGVTDFFVTYGPDRDLGNRDYGALLAIPWGGDYRCQWGWVDVDDGRDLTKRVISPDVDASAREVRGDGWERGRWRSRGVFEYLGSSSSYVFRKTFDEGG